VSREVAVEFHLRPSVPEDEAFLRQLNQLAYDGDALPHAVGREDLELKSGASAYSEAKLGTR
jgi:hypothetical protein